MKYDAIIIGAGQAGPGIAITFAGEGKKVAVIEGDKLGGTCLNYGCRPTKALRASARVAHMARRAAEYGVNVGPVAVDFAAVMARKDDIIGGMQEGFRDYFENLDNVDIYRDYGHFVGTKDGLHQIQAGDTVLESEQVYINVGTRAVLPPIEGLNDVPHMTNVDILKLKELPQHLVIVGGSYIGLEFGQMFRRFGSEVTIIERSAHVASREDADVSEELETILKNEGVKLGTSSTAVAVRQSGDGNITVTCRDDETGNSVEFDGSHLLLATGRRPNSDKLNLGSVGVKTDARGYITVNGHFETNIPGIWALGDVNGRGAFTHTSYQDYEILIANHKAKSAEEERTVDGRVMAYAMFTDPPLGHVGMHEREARASGRNVLQAVWRMDSVSRAQLDTETEGIVKMHVDADTEEILGATFLGMQGDDVVAIVSNFMATGASYKVMRDALPVHPTISEFLPTILGALEPLN